MLAWLPSLLVLGVGLGANHELEFADFGDEGDPRIRARILDESLALATTQLEGLGTVLAFESDSWCAADVQRPEG